MSLAGRVTDHIDAAIAQAAATNGRLALVPLSVMGLLALSNAWIVLDSLWRGTEREIGVAVGSHFLLGVLIPVLFLLICVASARPAGRMFWAALMLGGVIVALGPLRVLLIGDWDTPIYIAGRWGSGSWSTLSTGAWLLWGLAALMIGPGLFGMARSGAKGSRARSRAERGAAHTDRDIA